MISIDDMEMPENCHECPFNQGEYGKDYYEKCSCYITGRQMTKQDYKKRPNDCPLHEQRFDEVLDWICPSCKHFLTYEPNWRNISKRCQECGQLLEKLTREEAEEYNNDDWETKCTIECGR